MANILSQDEIDFLLNGGLPAMEAASEPAEQTQAKAVESEKNASEESLKTVGPAPVYEPRIKVTRAHAYHIPNCLDAPPLEDGQFRILKGNSMRDYRIPSHNMRSFDNVQRLDMGRVVVERLLALSDRFREKRRTEFVKELARYKNQYGQTVGLCLLRNEKKPVRVKLYGVPVLTLHKKHRLSDRALDWELAGYTKEQFGYEWGNWLCQNFDPQTLREMTQIA